MPAETVKFSCTADHMTTACLPADGVFGSTITKICEREKNTVPRFVQQVTTEIERRGLDIDGLYRVNGNLAQIQRVRFMVETSECCTVSGYRVG